MLARAALGVIAVALASLLPATASLADEAMTPQQIMSLTPGTFNAVVKGKWQVVVTLTRDGTITGKAGKLTDQGRWTLRGDQLCIVMPTFTRGRVECSEVVADSGWYRGRNVAFQPL